MTAWERWLKRPKTLWLRRALFQVHLWTGIALGLYVFIISGSGSAIVFRNELYNSLWPGPRIVTVGPRRLSHEQLRAAALRSYPEYKVTWIWDAKQPPNVAIEIWLDRKGRRKQRLFDPYTGRDLGVSHPYSIQLIGWLVDLHVNLLSGRTGRIANGVGAIFVLALAATGAVLWWPGVRAWRGSLTLRSASNWKRFNFQLHNVIGLWTLPIVFMFGVVGVYAGFPRSIQALVDKVVPLNVYRLEPQASIAPRVPLLPVSAAAPPRFRPPYSTGDQIIRAFSYLHFGNFGGWPSKALWTVIGLAPAFLFATGFLMWWNRIVGPALRRLVRHFTGL